MDQGLAIVLAAVIALGGVVVGLVGVMIGGRISAGAAREAAKIAADAAHESSVAAWATANDDRDEARAARFADRVRELAAQMLATADRFATAAEAFDGHERLNAKLATRMPETSSPSLDKQFGAAAQELHLLVRLPTTYAAIATFTQAVARMENELPWLGGVSDDFTAAIAACRRQVPTFEDAIRDELGRDPIKRPPRIPPIARPPKPPAPQASKPDPTT